MEEDSISPPRVCFGVIIYGFWCVVRVSAGSAVKYAAMPGIFPRLKDILFTGFGPVTQLIAIICFMAGLLPKRHPCFAKETRDQYGLIRILAAAADQVEFKWKSADKVIVFGLIVCGTIMMWLYLVGLVLYLLTSPAFAMGFSSMFETVNPTNDIAFMMLDRVFGLPGVFNSVVSTTAPFPTPFQASLQLLFSFYSMGIFFIAMTIFLYHIVHLVLEITQTGHVAEHMSDETGDGDKGFTWLPIRFVVCFGLLLPFGEGLNSAQWITLYTAKLGSGLATNAWMNYNIQTGDNPLGEENVRLVTKPNPPDSTGLIKSLLLMRSCIEMNYWEYGDNGGAHFVRGYVVNGSESRPFFRTMDGRSKYVDITGGNEFIEDQKSYTTNAADIASGMAGDPFIDILNFAGGGDIRIILGELDETNPTLYKEYPGGVLPVCGEISVPVTGATGEALFAAEGYLFAILNILFEVTRPGIDLSDYEDDLFIAVLREYNRNSSLVKDYLVHRTGAASKSCVFDGDDDGYETLSSGLKYLGPCTKSIPSEYWKTLMTDYYGFAFSVPPYTAYDYLADTDTAGTEIDTFGYYTLTSPSSWSSVGINNPMMISTGILDYGWGGAGLWYNKISERNGSLYTAANSLPIIKKLPLVMEQIKLERKKTDTSTGSHFCETFNPRKSGQGSSNSPAEKNQFLAEEAMALHALCTELHENEGIIITGTSRAVSTTNPIEGAIQSFFTEYKMFDPEKNSEVTPMAQLSSIGRTLIDKAILGVVASSAASAYGGMAHMMAMGGNEGADRFANSAGLLGGAVMSIAMIGLTSGIVLHYMLPFMPFIYFFFAVGRWVKVVFEAMVGVPLWALAHMRVGGPGLPGSAASGGYFLLLEILIRPILTVFSLVAAFAMFSALVAGLNSVFTLISENLFGGFNPSMATPDANVIQLARGLVDQFFLSIFYVALVYLLGTGSFKLIDLLPDNIMRWSGAGVQSMGAADISDDMVDQWQWEFPQRFQGAVSSAGGLVKKTLYDGPAAQNNDRIQKIKIEKAKAEQASKAENQTGGEAP